MKLTDRNYHELALSAQRAANRAYAPYSRFRVGSGVLTEIGIFTGANIENASYAASLCAERVALSAAKHAGALHIHAIAVACIDAATENLGQLMPCGICRQWMAELAPSATILVCGPTKIHKFSVTELLPHPFILNPEPTAE